MDGLSRIGKNNAIKEHGKETRIRHASMRPLCVELKLDLKCLNRSEQEKLWHYFTQCRWLCNHHEDEEHHLPRQGRQCCRASAHHTGQVHPVGAFVTQA